MQMDTIDNEPASRILRDTLSRIASMRALYDNLLDTGEYRTMQSQKYLQGLTQSIRAIFPESETITINTAIEDIPLPSKVLFQLGIAMNELLTNIMKYAFEPGQQGLVKISLEKKADNVVFEVSDNGKGLPPKQETRPGGGFGLPLVSMIAESLLGECTVDVDHGTRVTITIPHNTF